MVPAKVSVGISAPQTACLDPGNDNTIKNVNARSEFVSVVPDASGQRIRLSGVMRRDAWCTPIDFASGSTCTTTRTWSVV